jgi:hypothetical protein
MKEVKVRYLCLPDIEDGVSGFYEYHTDKKCTEPSKSYSSGRCHTTEEELDELAVKVGFLTRDAYVAERKKNKFKSWKNAYGTELSVAVGNALETNGVVWKVNESNILFQCPKGEFIPWPANKHIKRN